MSILYYRIPFFRCAELDIIFGALIAWCIYIIMKPMLASQSSVSKVEKIVEATTPKVEKKERRIYTTDFIRSVNPGIVADAHFSYKVTSRPVAYRQSHSPTPYGYRKSPDPYTYFQNHSPNPDNFISRSPRGRLDPEDEEVYKKMRELTPDYVSDEEQLPKETMTGRVHYFVKNTGRIHCPQPILGQKDVFFHLKDCELEEGDKIRLGDSVMFEVSIHDNLLCAINVKKIERIPSPVITRRAVKQSNLNDPDFTELSL